MPGISPVNNDHNIHISLKDLSILLTDEIAGIEELIGSRVSLEPLGRLKEVADATTKFLIRSATGRPEAVLVCSRPVAPDLVKRGLEIAESIRELIGQRLGEAIIKPTQSGYVGGRSYVILPWCREFSAFRMVRVLQRLALTRPLLNWLQEATEVAAATQGHSDKTRQSFHGVLEHLARQSFLDDEIKVAIETSMRRLETKRWQPRHSFDHNDLWLGNVMLPAHTGRGLTHRYPFVLIDWGGANNFGYGIYDLIRLAIALKLSSSSLHRQLVAHSTALQCDPEDTRGHLLAAFGRLHQHLECFPEERYIQTLRNCWSTFQQAI